MPIYPANTIKEDIAIVIMAIIIIMACTSMATCVYGFSVCSLTL